MTFAEGALLEPLSVVLQGLRVAGLTLGRGAVVCGAGPIGLTAVLAARASGAHPLVVTDVEPKRLAFAKQLVPSCLAYRVDPALDARGNARGIRKLFGARGGEGEEGDEYLAPPCVLECTGVESSVCTAAFTVRRGGRVVVVGVGKDTMNNLPFMHLSLSEVCDTDEPPPPPPGVLSSTRGYILSFRIHPSSLGPNSSSLTVHFFADRCPLHQSVHRHLASGHFMSERWHH